MRFATGEDLERFLGEHPDTRYIDALFIDICGIPRGKRIPRAEYAKIFKSGVQIPYSTYLLDAAGETADPCGLGYGDGDPDGLGRPLAGSLVPVPWSATPRAQVLMSMVDEAGGPYPNEPRNVAARVLERFGRRGLRPVVAFELEFYLVDRQPGGDGFPMNVRDAATGEREADTQVYGMDQLEVHQELLDDIIAACEVQGIPATVITKEFAPGQYEVNLSHVDDPLAAADHAVLLRNVVRNVARAAGLDATFMSKPFAATSGSGMHVHMSLLDDDGRNVFESDDPLNHAPLRHAVGGMVETMFDGFSIMAPNVNALRRFCPNLYVPVAPAWGVNNRSLAFRIPFSEAAATRIEHRLAGADANPYLVLAAILAAVDHGMENHIDPGPASVGNVCLEADTRLPRHMWQALDLTEASPVLGEYLGKRYLTLYCETKRAELDHFYSAPTAAEFRWYL